LGFIEYKKEKTVGVRRRNDAKKKASKVIDKINEWHFQTIGAEDQGGNILISMEDFFNGLFPWQLSHQKGNYVADQSHTSRQKFSYGSHPFRTRLYKRLRGVTV
jgi:hypothetical protein